MLHFVSCLRRLAVLQLLLAANFVIQQHPVISVVMEDLTCCLCSTNTPAGDFADRGPEWVYKGAGIAMPQDSEAGPSK
jgi:hypothetical protein